VLPSLVEDLGFTFPLRIIWIKGKRESDVLAFLMLGLSWYDLLIQMKLDYGQFGVCTDLCNQVFAF